MSDSRTSRAALESYILRSERIQYFRLQSVSGHYSVVYGSSGTQGSVDGPAGTARFVMPRGLALTQAGVYVVDINSATGVAKLRRIAIDTTTSPSTLGSVSTMVQGWSYSSTDETYAAAAGSGVTEVVYMNDGSSILRAQNFGSP